MKNLFILFFLFLFVFYGKKNPENTIEKPNPDQIEEETDTSKYVALFYFSGFGDDLFSPDALSPSGDSWIMNKQLPAYSPHGIVCFWGKPLWAAQHGDKTIKIITAFTLTRIPISQMTLYYTGMPIR